MLRRSIIALLLVAGCGGSGDAIDLTVVLDASVPDADVARIAALELTVTEAESFTTRLPAAGKLGGRRGGLRYRPKRRSGTDRFILVARDGTGAMIVRGSLDVALAAGTQQRTLVLGAANGGLCGNGRVDAGELCDPAPGSASPCPTVATDCDDHDDCTDDAVNGSECQAACAHTATTNGIACRAHDAGGLGGTCAAGACCTGCVDATGACKAGGDTAACGAGGSACFDCGASGRTCQASGQCSNCTADSCKAEGRTCGKSSCGFDCGGCADQCLNGGTLNHFVCDGKSCQPSGGGNCGLYAVCIDGATCAATCAGDNDCIASAYCDGHVCKKKVGLGGACSEETTGDHECQSPYVCSWEPDVQRGLCTKERCTGCWAARQTGECDDYIVLGRDPRQVCAGYTGTACHANYCAGPIPGADFRDRHHLAPASCDVGADGQGNPRPCGPITCANMTTYSTVTGALCELSTMTCQQNQSASCTIGDTNNDSDYEYACNASGCDYTRQIGR